MTQITNINDIPQPLLLEILSHVKDFSVVAQVCKAWCICVEELREKFLKRIYEIEPFYQKSIEIVMPTSALHDKIDWIFKAEYTYSKSNRFALNPKAAATPSLPYEEAAEHRCTAEILGEELYDASGEINAFTFVKRARENKRLIPLDEAFFTNLVKTRKRNSQQLCERKILEIAIPRYGEELEGKKPAEIIEIVANKIGASNFIDPELNKCLHYIMKYWNMDAFLRVLGGLQNQPIETTRVSGFKLCFNSAAQHSFLEALTELHPILQPYKEKYPDIYKLPEEQMCNFNWGTMVFLSKNNLWQKKMVPTKEAADKAAENFAYSTLDEQLKTSTDGEELLSLAEKYAQRISSEMPTLSARKLEALLHILIIILYRKQNYDSKCFKILAKIGITNFDDLLTFALERKFHILVYRIVSLQLNSSFEFLFKKPGNFIAEVYRAGAEPIRMIGDEEEDVLLGVALKQKSSDLLKEMIDRNKDISKFFEGKSVEDSIEDFQDFARLEVEIPDETICALVKKAPAEIFEVILKESSKEKTIKLTPQFLDILDVRYRYEKEIAVSCLLSLTKFLYEDFSEISQIDAALSLLVTCDVSSQEILKAINHQGKSKSDDMALICLALDKKFPSATELLLKRIALKGVAIEELISTVPAQELLRLAAENMLGKYRAQTTKALEPIVVKLLDNGADLQDVVDLLSRAPYIGEDLKDTVASKKRKWTDGDFSLRPGKIQKV